MGLKMACIMGGAGCLPRRASRKPDSTHVGLQEWGLLLGGWLLIVQAWGQAVVWPRGPMQCHDTKFSCEKKATALVVGTSAVLQQHLAAEQQRWKVVGTVGLTMNINFTKKPMKPITTKPMAVLEQILLNSAQGTTHKTATSFSKPSKQQFHLPGPEQLLTAWSMSKRRGQYVRNCIKHGRSSYEGEEGCDPSSTFQVLDGKLTLAVRLRAALHQPNAVLAELLQGLHHCLAHVAHLHCAWLSFYAFCGLFLDWNALWRQRQDYRQQCTARGDGSPHGQSNHHDS